MMRTRSSVNPKAWFDRICTASKNVFQELGPGRRENTYQQAIQHEMHQRHQELFATEVSLPITYKGKCVAMERLDLLLHNIIFIEVKAVSKLQTQHEEQVKAYVRDMHIPGVLVNFPTKGTEPSCRFFDSIN